MPKNNVVASFVGNCSPVKRRTAILVRSVRHVRGEMGEELNNRAIGGQGKKVSIHNQGRNATPGRSETDRPLPS